MLLQKTWVQCLRPYIERLSTFITTAPRDLIPTRYIYSVNSNTHTHVHTHALTHAQTHKTAHKIMFRILVQFTLGPQSLFRPLKNDKNSVTVSNKQRRAFDVESRTEIFQCRQVNI